MAFSDHNFKYMPKEKHKELSRKGGINSGKSRRRVRLLSNIVDLWIEDALKAFDRDMDKVLDARFNAIVDMNMDDLERAADKLIDDLERAET